jgi:hypothetical protein
MMATQLLVVPRSMPMILPMVFSRVARVHLQVPPGWFQKLFLTGKCGFPHAFQGFIWGPIR